MTGQTPADPQLSERAKQLLKVLVQSYIRSGEPVGSRTLARTNGLALSPATVRNVMADLEDLGLVASPHTSAGRIPTAKGYRLFIDTMLSVTPPAQMEVESLKRELDPDQDPHGLLEAASGLLSGITQLAGVVTLPRRSSSALRQIEFLSLSENRVLVILVVNRREVQNRIIYLERPYTQSELQSAANYLNGMFAGRSLQAARRSLLAELERVREDVDRTMRSAIELGEKALADELEQPDYVMAGQANLMEYAELSDIEKLRRLFQAFSEKRDILHLLDQCIHAQGVQIFIGQESGYQILDGCSVVTAPYSVEGNVVGVLGVIGPTRMAYDRVIPIVDITARLLGAALNSRA